MENAKENILDILSKISDLKFQKEVWKEQKHWDKILNFGEAVNTLDDYSFFDSNEIWGTLSDYEVNQIQDFKTKLENYEENTDMLNDKNWILITDKAKEIHSLLK